MKQLIALITLVVSLNGFASIRPTEAELLVPVLVTDVEVFGNLMSSDPAMTTIDFEVEFCRSVDSSEFKLEVERTNMEAFAVAIKPTQPMEDCMGPTHRQFLTLRSAKLPPYGTLSIKNPVLVRRTIVH